MALLIRPDGSRAEVQGNSPNNTITLKQLYNLIGCTMVERIPCDPQVTGGYDGCYIDEEGKFKSIELNPQATKLCTWIASDDFITGKVVFVKGKDGEDY